jgi:O-antigen/teichoic acid export membrane protein
MDVMDTRHQSAAASGDTASLGRTAVRAVLWNYLSFASGKLLVLITMAVLARLLTPEEFGIMGFAVLAVTYLAVLKDLGLGGALIQRRQDAEEAAQTVYVANLVLGVVLTATTFAAAPAVAGFFGEPLVVPLLRVLSFTFVLEALGAIHLVLLRRNLDFRRKMVPDLGRALVKGVVSIGAAIWGFGVWALVWGQLAGVLAAVFLSWAVVPWRPTFRIHRRLLRPLMRFGGPLVVTDIAHAVWLNLDYVVVGRLLGDHALGVYTLAYRLPELLVMSIWRVITQAAFPFFSSIQDHPELLSRGFLATIRYSQIAIVPICVGLFVAADPIVGVAFGSQWAEAVPIVRLMAVFMLVGSVGVNIGDVYKAIGRPDVLAKLAIIDFVVLAPALVVGANLGGLVGVAWAHAAVALVDTSIRLVVAHRMIEVTYREIGRMLLPSLKAGTVLAGVAGGVVVVTAGLGDLAQLTLTACAGIVTYTAAIWMVDRAALVKMADWAGIGRFLPGGAR